MIPRSKNTDPETSHAAERRMRASGAMDHHTKAVYNLVAANPLKTSTELCTLAEGRAPFSLDPHERLYQIRRRLSDLLHIMDRVERRPQGRESIWELTGVEKELQELL